MGRRLTIVAYLITVHLALLSVVAKPDLAYRAAKKIGVRGSVHRGMEWMRDIQSTIDKHVPKGAVVFLGDSHTQRLFTPMVDPVSVNYGISGQRSDQLIESMRHYHSMERAAAVVVTIGTNDIIQGRAAGLEERYRVILAHVPARVPVVMSSIPPIAGRLAEANAANEAVKAACKADRRCRFAEVVELSAPGTLEEDGVHLSEQGYAVWTRALREAVQHHKTPFSSATTSRSTMMSAAIS